jgi:hypothetical protein
MNPKKQSEKQILDLHIEQFFFDQILAGTKTEEFRDRTEYWKTRLEGREYDEIRFREGYKPDSPKMYVEWKGVKKPPLGKQYAIQLGKILRLENCDK